MEPFRFTGMISGHNFGIRKGSDLWFPEEPQLYVDDLWVSALNAFKHRFHFQDMRYSCAVKDTFKATGGMAQIRTQEGIKRNERMLKEAFGSAIYRREQSHVVKLRNEIQLNLKVPW
jgi:hypothetical protein